MCGPAGLREYLNWKVLDTAIFAIMGVALHRLWWDGCGYLPQDSCWDMRYTFVSSTLMSLLLPIYCTWAIWSLLNILKFGDDEAMIMAGFVPQVPPLCHPSQPIPSHENLPSPSPSPLNLVLSHCRALRRFCGGEWYKAMVAEKAIILMS